MEDLTIGFSYYDQPLMAQEWWPHLRPYPQTPRVRFVLVDDASPNHALDVPEDIRACFDVRVYRVDQNIPWNQPGARNLIMHVAETSWVLLVDIDHIVPSVLVEQLAGFVPHESTYYKLGRYDVRTHAPMPMNPNQLLISRTDFWRAGGYDEDFCGHRGHDDHMLHRMLKARKVALSTLPDYRLASYSTWDVANDESDVPPISDAAVPSSVFSRDPAHNRALLERKLKDLEQDGVDAFWCNNADRLRFSWYEI